MPRIVAGLWKPARKGNPTWTAYEGSDSANDWVNFNVDSSPKFPSENPVQLTP